MDAKFLEAFINREHKVLGRTLHPFCLRDRLLLEIDDNAFAVGGTPDAADLISAVRICSTPFEKKVTTWSMVRDVLWGWRAKFKYNLDVEMEKFATYVLDYDSRPTFWDAEDSSDSTVKAPWAYSLACYIEAFSNMTEEQIMTAPIGLMFWKSAVIAEKLGHTKAELESDEEREAMKALGLGEYENEPD